MISVYNIKPKFQQLLKPILEILYKGGITANMITWVAIILSCLSGLLVWMHPFGITFILLPIFLLVRMALNALDGMMARNYNMQSKIGELLNELGDVISDFIMFFPLFKLFHLNLYILITFLFLSLINEFVGILGKVVSGVRRYEGPMGKSDRAFVIGLTSLIFFFHPELNLIVNYIFIFCIMLLLVSTAVRIFKTLK